MEPVTLWPVWPAYLKLWRYAQTVPVHETVTVPRWLPKEPLPRWCGAVQQLDTTMSQALAAGPLALDDNLYRTYLFLFVQWLRVSHPLSPFFDGHWRNLRWLPITALAGNPEGAVKAWLMWRNELAVTSMESLLLRYPLVPEPGEIDVAKARVQTQALAAVLKTAEHPTRVAGTLRKQQPAGGWHPWVTLACLALYKDPTLLAPLKRTLASIIASTERWRAFVDALPHLSGVPAHALTSYRRALLLRLDDMARTWPSDTQQVWRRRRRLLLTPLSDARGA